MKAKLTKPPKGRQAGEIIEHEEAHLLVEMGIAEPADDECAEVAAMQHASQAESEKQRLLVREQRKAMRIAKAEAAIKARQAEFADSLGIETAEDIHAKGAEKRESP